MRYTILVLSALLLAGCAPMTIGRINADPSHFQNRTVRVSGTVTNSVGLMGKGGYQIEDNTGRIIVVSGKGWGEGKRVREGKTRGRDLGGLPAMNARYAL